MKAKTKIIIALSLAGVITLGAVIALVVVIASFNATSGSGLKVSYVAKNVQAKVSMEYAVFESEPWANGRDDIALPDEITYSEVGTINFNVDDTAETASKSFDGVDVGELAKDGYVYLKYTFEHTGDGTNSGKYLNVKINDSFTVKENIQFEYMLLNPDGSYPRTYNTGSLPGWMAGINGLTITYGVDDVCVLYVRLSVDVKTQDASLDGSIVFNMTTSDTEYYANLKGMPMQDDTSITSVSFGKNTAQNLAKVEGVTPTLVSADGSGPINKYTLADGATYILSDADIYATTCAGMFQHCGNLTSVDLTCLNTSNVKYTGNVCWTSSEAVVGGMFQSCSSLTTIVWGGFDTSNVVDMGFMFCGCSSLPELDVSILNTSKVTNMDSMFFGCSGLSWLDVSGFNTSKVTNMHYMFGSCSGLESDFTLDNFDFTNVTNISFMFAGCSNLYILCFGDFLPTGRVAAEGAFAGCSTLRYIYVNNSWDSVYVDATPMFVACMSLVGERGTAYDDSVWDDASYARIDTAGNPGYFWRTPV